MPETTDAPSRSARLNYVGGAWVPASSGETYTKPNPMRPSETVGEFASSSDADAAEAGEGDEPLRESRGEAGRASQILRFAASEAFRSVGEHFEQAATGAQVSTRRRPVGVVALITPWNFPLAIPVWKLAPALIYGNTVVLKLAYESPLTGLLIAAAIAEADPPAGVLNVLTGRGSVVGAALVRDPRVRAISFTGSVATGTSVRDEATRLGKR